MGFSSKSSSIGSDSIGESLSAFSCSLLSYRIASPVNTNTPNRHRSKLSERPIYLITMAIGLVSLVFQKLARISLLQVEKKNWFQIR